MAQNRLQALDVMRGMTIAAMLVFNNSGGHFAPLRHAVWNGLTPTDLAYPFFMFIMGVSVCFSLRKYASSMKAAALGRILRRTVSIFLLGVFLSNFSKMVYGTITWDNIRIMGVLQRLALAYGFGSVIYLFVPRKWHLPIAGALLGGYICFLKCCNGYVHSEENVLARFDALVMGQSHMYTEKLGDTRIFFEPESILGTVSGIAHVLLGTFVGGLILDNPQNEDRVRKIAVFGTILLFIGFLLQYTDPINKTIWTSSFVLVTCGSGSLLLSLLIQIIGIRGWKKWTPFFNAYGGNAVVAYSLAGLLGPVIGRIGLKKWLIDSVFTPVAGPDAAGLLYAFFIILLIRALILPLYKRDIHVRL